jgi:hypothetical protein
MAWVVDGEAPLLVPLDAPPELLPPPPPPPPQAAKKAVRPAGQTQWMGGDAVAGIIGVDTLTVFCGIASESFSGVQAAELDSMRFVILLCVGC